MIKSPLKFILNLFLKTLVLIAVSLVLISVINPGHGIKEILAGYLASLVIFGISFLSVYLAQKKSFKTFFLVVIGGMFVRFLLIAALLYAVIRYTELDAIYFITTFVAFYVLYQFFEVRFLNANMDKGRRWQDSTKRA